MLERTDFFKKKWSKRWLSVSFERKKLQKVTETWNILHRESVVKLDENRVKIHKISKKMFKLIKNNLKNY